MVDVKIEINSQICKAGDTGREMLRCSVFAGQMMDGLMFGELMGELMDRSGERWTDGGW